MPYNDPNFPDFLAGPPFPPMGPEVGPWYDSPWLDRAAPETDDQLAVFSRVGRGMKGDSYKVVIHSDSDMETYLKGMSYDEASGTWASEWISENINGGRLDYQYNLRPYTIPQTFTITFRYRRPNRDPWQWVWTTPAIPYIWDADNDGFGDTDGIVGVGAATLFLKKTQDSWITTNLPTSYTISEALTRQEKLLYPTGWTRELLNAPIPGDPYTVNLTYGIGGDFDAPNIEDLARILGMTVNHIRYLAANGTLPTTDPLNQGENLRQYIDRKDGDIMTHMHNDMGFGDHLISDDNDASNLTIKKYIDNMVDNVDVVSSDPSLLGVTKTTRNHTIGNDGFAYGIKYELDPINPIAGSGIKLTNSGGNLTIANNIIAGPGVQITRRPNGALVISNTQVGGDWIDLVEGRDFEYSMHNGWYFGVADGNVHTNPSPSEIQPPDIKVLISRDLEDNIVGAEFMIKSLDPHLLNKYDILDQSKFRFTHAENKQEFDSNPDNAYGAIMSVTFKGDYADLNNLDVIDITSIGTNIWNVYGTDGSLDSTSGWHLCGASWTVNCACVKNVSGYKKFLFFAINIADGYNIQYSTPNYGYSHLAIRPFANFDWKVSLG